LQTAGEEFQVMSLVTGFVMNFTDMAHVTKLGVFFIVHGVS